MYHGASTAHVCASAGFIAPRKSHNKIHFGKNIRSETKRSTFCKRNSKINLSVRTSWWRHQNGNFPRYWPFVPGIHQSPVNSPHKGQWRGAFIFSLICNRINSWVKKLWCWWFETPSCPLWRHRYDCCILISTSLKFIPKSSVNYKTTVAEIMVWCRIGNKVLSDPKATWLSSICIYVPHEFTYIKYIYLHIHKLPNLPFFYWLCVQSPIYQKRC